jgi:predicted ATPase
MMTIAHRVTIHIEGQHGSISNLEWQDVPPFAVMTGVNGAGKSQLLEVLAHSYGALQPRYSRLMGSQPPEIRARARIEGASFALGEVYHSYGEWPQLDGSGVSEQQIKDAIRALHSERQNDRFWQTFADRLGRTVEDATTLSIEEFYEALTPNLLWGWQLPRIARNLSFLFLAYRLFDRDAQARGVSPCVVRQRYGEPPWDLMNEILETSGLPFRVNSPVLEHPTSLVYSPHYTVCLHDTERHQDVPFETLSSGEKVIMSTVFWRYGAEQLGRHYRLLLLDEPDAHLHPSLTRRFLNVIQRVFVEERGVRVIMSTHSPSTVALTPAESLFEMRRTPPRIRPARSKSHAVALLTDGFVTVHEGMQIVLLEGKDDLPFYNLVWELLTESSTISEPGPLERSPSLTFLYGQGRTIIELLIPQMRSHDLPNFHGIIDRDTSNTPADGVYVLSRYGMENYLFDPMNVWVSLFLEHQEPSVAGVSVPHGRGALVRELPQEQLQRIADTVLNTVENSLADLQEQEKTREEVTFVNGKRVMYPRWFLTRDGKQIRGKWRKMFGSRALTDEKMLRSYETLNLIPQDLLELLRMIQATGEP